MRSKLQGSNLQPIGYFCLGLVFDNFEPGFSVYPWLLWTRLGDQAGLELTEIPLPLCLWRALIKGLHHRA